MRPVAARSKLAQRALAGLRMASEPTEREVAEVEQDRPEARPAGGLFRLLFLVLACLGLPC